MSLHSTLRALIERTDLSVSETQIDKLIQFVELIHKWNAAYNLSAIKQPEEMLVRHILDSIVVSPYITEQKNIDVGTGPGLPGIPLAIMHPEKSFTLADSLGKRVRFVKQAIFELNLRNVTPIQGRVETLNTEKFDCIFSRAFASLSDFVNWSEHLLTSEGYFLALKGQLQSEEISSLPDNFSVAYTTPLLVPSLRGERHLVKVVRR
ncbi:MAG: 16S rRNA (guanine(527)-N(7))-methyltransferase RsmG [Pseudomonadota bacterium]